MCAAALLQGVRLEADVAAVKEWLTSPAAAPAVALAAAARNAAGPHEALAETDADRDARCRRALRAVQVHFLSRLGCWKILPGSSLQTPLRWPLLAWQLQTGGFMCRTAHRFALQVLSKTGQNLLTAGVRVA